jgi:hypothetical protein
MGRFFSRNFDWKWARPLTDLGYSSKLNAEWEFLTMLRDEGRRSAEEFLTVHAVNPTVAMAPPHRIAVSTLRRSISFHRSSPR